MTYIIATTKYEIIYNTFVLNQWMNIILFFMLSDYWYKTKFFFNFK